MHWADINAALYKAGSSPGQVAEELDVRHNAVSQTIRGQIASYNIASHIAAITSIPLNRLFPDGRYSQPPKRNRRSAA